jgi:hypothetical protein
MSQNKSKSAIIILVARTNIIYRTLTLFYKNSNNKFQYPIYIHTFGDLIDDDLKKKINNEIDSTIKFITIYPKIPSHIDEKDLYYNRNYHDYVKKTFSKKRIGFLHMCYFLTNITNFGHEGCISSELENYENLMFYDDDIHYKTEIKFDLFESLTDYPLVTAFTSKLEKNETNLACVENLWEFYKNYIALNKIIPKDKLLSSAITSNDDNVLFQLDHSSGCMELYNMKKFKNDNWYNFINEVNKYGGNYKFRWNNNFIINLYLRTYYDDPIKNLNLLENEIIDIKFPGSDQFIYFDYKDYYNSKSFKFLVDLKNIFSKMYNKL